MENVTMTISPGLPIVDVQPCDSENEVYNYALYGVAGGIIIVLTLLETRNDRDKCRGLWGHPGLVFPVNLLDHNNDRISIAAAFGSMASVCFKLFTTTDNNFANLKEVPAWSKTLYIMATVVTYGLLYYPVFACLSTQWIFIGNLLGAAFSVCLFVLNLRTILNCFGTADEFVPGQTIATQVPVLVCLCFLILRFSWKFFYHAYLTAKKGRILREAIKCAAIVEDTSEESKSKVHQACVQPCKVFVCDEDAGSVPDNIEERRLSEPHHVTYVKNLLYTARYTTIDEHKVVANLKIVQSQSKTKLVLKKISSLMYKNDPLFKYSPKIIAIVVVSIICVYQFSILILLAVKLIVDGLNTHKESNSNMTNSSSGAGDKSATEAIFQVRLFLKVFIGCILFSFTVSLLFTVWSSFQILTNYRVILKAMFKGDFRAVHFKRSDFYAQTILSNCLSYAGSQIAYLLWGYLVSLVFLTIVCILLSYLVVLPITGDVPISIFKYIVLNIAPGFVIICVFRVLQFLWSRLLIQKIDSVDDTGQPTKTAVLALNNRKAYHNVSFFLFLFYIVLGIFGCFFTIIKGIVLGTIYLSRLDKCRLMSGFESFDAAYLYFISFMYVEETHRHPVLLVFCDTLLEKHRVKHKLHLHEVIANVPNSYSTFDSTSLLGRSLSTLPRARLRWLNAYTLVRNPGLVKDADHGFEKIGEISDLSNGSLPRTLIM